MHNGAKMTFPIIPVAVCSRMTRTTKRDAITGIGIRLAIINMVNMIAAFPAFLASVVIALADHAFESIVERGRILFQRCTAFPARILATGMYFANARTFMPTGARTKFSVREMSFKSFPTCPTNFSQWAPFPVRGLRAFSTRCGTGFRTIFAIKFIFGNLISFAAILTNFFNRPTLPMRCLFASLVNSTDTTRPGTIFLIYCNLPRREKHSFAAVLTKLHNFWFWCWHIIALKGAPLLANQCWCSGNTAIRGAY